MTWAVSIILTIYILWLLFMIVNWLRIDTDYNENRTDTLFYSIIVPFRNEVKNLPNLLHSLSQLKFDSYEIIIVDDHSDDDFEDILKGLKLTFKHIPLPTGITGKKAALQLGIKAAKGDIIVTTDADCLHKPNWLKVFDYYFSQREAEMVFGGVAFENDKRLFSQLQMIEFAPLIGTGAASLQLGLPAMCNGANLAFRKSAFDFVDGYEGNEHIASGDDEFLLTKIHHEFPHKVFYAKQSDAVVTTSSCKTLGEFFNQRKRWASKWSANNSWYKSLLAVLIFLSTLATVASVFIITSYCSILIMVLLGVKILFDGIFIALVLKSLQRPFSFFNYMIAQILYPIYVLIFGIAANFGKYHWKGRSH
jgi:poly-beta-1,6-N-acetyl-D-glucosamine synthase